MGAALNMLPLELRILLKKYLQILCNLVHVCYIGNQDLVHAIHLINKLTLDFWSISFNLQNEFG